MTGEHHLLTPASSHFLSGHGLDASQLQQILITQHQRTKDVFLREEAEDTGTSTPPLHTPWGADTKHNSIALLTREEQTKINLLSSSEMRLLLSC